MDNIQLYDFIKLSDNYNYAVIGMTDLNNVKYYLLSKVLDDDSLSVDAFKFVEVCELDGKKIFKIVKDTQILDKLALIFSEQINNI